MTTPDHSVTLDLDTGWVNAGQAVMTCHAPADALCHATYDCDCERLYRETVREGSPVHWTADDTKHVGRFDPRYCRYRVWADNSDECFTGKVTVPVVPSWDGDCYTFRADQQS